MSLPDPLPNPYSYPSTHRGQPVTITVATNPLPGETPEETQARHRANVEWLQTPRDQGGGGFPPTS